MATYKVPTTIKAADIRCPFGSIGGGALTVDATGPNTTAPVDGRVTVVPISHGAEVNAFVTFSGGTSCTVVGYVYSVVAARWYQLFSVSLTMPDVMVPVVTAGNEEMSIPQGVPLFLSITINTGATFIGVL